MTLPHSLPPLRIINAMDAQRIAAEIIAEAQAKHKPAWDAAVARFHAAKYREQVS